MREVRGVGVVSLYLVHDDVDQHALADVEAVEERTMRRDRS